MRVSKDLVNNKDNNSKQVTQDFNKKDKSHILAFHQN